MDITTFLILVTFYLVAIVISMFIEDKTYKMYYFLIIALATLVFLNVYLSIIYYIKLRNEPGIPGPRGTKGEQGPTGSKGKCVSTGKCGFTKAEADKMLYDLAANKFETSKTCLREPTLNNCQGGASEVERIKPVNKQVQMLEEMAQQGLFTKQEFEKKIKNSMSNL